MKVQIFDKEKNCFFEDEDGERLSFNNETDAKNFLFTEGYKLIFVENNLQFIETYLID